MSDRVSKYLFGLRLSSDIQIQVRLRFSKKSGHIAFRNIIVNHSKYNKRELYSHNYKYHTHCKSCKYYYDKYVRNKSVLSLQQKVLMEGMHIQYAEIDEDGIVKWK